LRPIGGATGLDGILAEIIAAGRDAIALYEGGAANRTVRKPDRSPVTEADRAVEDRLRAYLTSRFPHVAFTGEESGSSTTEGDLRVRLDPLVGTRAFIRGTCTWSILLTLDDRNHPAR